MGPARDGPDRTLLIWSGPDPVVGKNAVPRKPFPLPSSLVGPLSQRRQRMTALPRLMPMGALAAPAVRCTPSRQTRRITTAECMVRPSRSFISCHWQRCWRAPFKGARTLSSPAVCCGRERACPNGAPLDPWPPVLNMLAGYGQFTGHQFCGVLWAHQLGRRRQRRSTSTTGMGLSTRQRRSTSRAPPRCLR